MTWDAQEMVDLLQGSVTRVMTRKREKEHKGKVALFEKSFQDLTWHVLEGKEEGLRGSKTLLYSMVQLKEQQEKV